MAQSSPRELETPPEDELSHPATQRDIWLTCLCSLGPTVWFLLLVAMYASSQHECGPNTAPISWGLMASGVVACVGAVLLLLRVRTQQLQAPEPNAIKRRRVQFMLDSGLLLNGLSLVLLASFAFPLLWLRPCE